MTDVNTTASGNFAATSCPEGWTCPINGTARVPQPDTACVGGGDEQLCTPNLGELPKLATALNQHRLTQMALQDRGDLLHQQLHADEVQAVGIAVWLAVAFVAAICISLVAEPLSKALWPWFDRSPDDDVEEDEPALDPQP